MNWDWKDPRLWAGLVGVVLGFGLNALRDIWRQRREDKARLRALVGELDICRQMAESFLNDNVHSPLYRLPILVATSSLPLVLARPAFQDSDSVRVVLEFFGQVQAFNRGLDQAHDALGNDDATERELNRNVTKAKQLVPGTRDDPTLHDRARRVLASLAS